MDATIEARVVKVVVRTLGIEDRASKLTAATPLFGSMPELDSLAVLELVSNLETEFSIRIDDEDITGDTFDTVGSLAAFVASAAV